VYAPAFQPGFFSPCCGQFTLFGGNGDVRLSSISLYGREGLHSLAPTLARRRANAW